MNKVKVNYLINNQILFVASCSARVQSTWTENEKMGGGNHKS